jgi:hypothetical protein
MSPLSEFSVTTQEAALARQGKVCASCGSAISGLAAHGAATVRSPNGGHAHPLRPFGNGGSRALSNCVVLCASCDFDELESDAFSSDVAVGRRNGFAYYESVRAPSRIKPAKASR